MEGLTEVLSGYRTKEAELNTQQSTYKNKIAELTARLEATQKLADAAGEELGEVAKNYRSTLFNCLTSTSKSLEERNDNFLAGKLTYDEYVLSGDQRVIEFYEASIEDPSITKPLQDRYNVALQRQKQTATIEAGVIVERHGESAKVYVTVSGHQDGTGLVRNLKEAALNAAILSGNTDFKVAGGSTFAMEVERNVDGLIEYLNMQAPADFEEAKVQYKVIDLSEQEVAEVLSKTEPAAKALPKPEPVAGSIDDKVKEESAKDDNWLTRDEVSTLYGARYDSLRKQVQEKGLNLMVEKGPIVGKNLSVRINRNSLLRVLKEIDPTFEVYSLTKASETMAAQGNSLLKDDKSASAYKAILLQMHEEDNVLLRRSSGRYQISNHALEVLTKNYFANAQVEILFEKGQVEITRSKTANLLYTSEEAVGKMVQKGFLKRSHQGVEVASLADFVNTHKICRYNRWTKRSKK